MWIGLFLALANQLAGNNAVTYYAPIILADAGFDGDTTKSVVTVALGAWKFICILIAFVYVFFCQVIQLGLSLRLESVVKLLITRLVIPMWTLLLQNEILFFCKF